MSLHHPIVLLSPNCIRRDTASNAVSDAVHCKTLQCIASDTASDTASDDYQKTTSDAAFSQFESSVQLQVLQGGGDTWDALSCRSFFCKRATNYRALLRKITTEDRASYDSTPPCTGTHHLNLFRWCVNLFSWCVNVFQTSFISL